MADYDDIQSQIDALKALVSSRKGGARPKKVAVAEEAEDVVYEEAPRPARKAPAPKKAPPAPKSVELRVSRPEPRVPVRATVPAHRCNCPDCPHKS
jgi:hypothetical protein